MQNWLARYCPNMRERGARCRCWQQRTTPALFDNAAHRCDACEFGDDARMLSVLGKCLLERGSHRAPGDGYEKILPRKLIDWYAAPTRETMIGRPDEHDRLGRDAFGALESPLRVKIRRTEIEQTWSPVEDEGTMFYSILTGFLSDLAKPIL